MISKRVFINFLLHIFFFIIELSNSLPCLSPSKNYPEKCYSCGFTYYRKGTTSPIPFNVSECVPKINESLAISILVLFPNSNSTCLDCEVRKIIVQRDLENSLTYIEENCKLYLLCEISMHLEVSEIEQPYLLIKSYKTEYFRRLNISLTIQPLWCGILSSDVPCASNKNYSQVILIKNPFFKIFVSGSLLIYNILWDGSDLFFKNYDNYCYKNSKCCLDSQTNNPEDICFFKSPTSYANNYEDLKSYGILNVESIIDKPLTNAPLIVINSCKFINIYSSGEDQGFKSLIRFVGYSIYNISIYSSYFENMYFIEGIFNINFSIGSLINDPIYSELSPETIKNIISFGDFDISNLSSLVLLKNISILNYNLLGNKLENNGIYDESIPIFRFYSNSLFKESIYIDGLKIANITAQKRNLKYLLSFSLSKTNNVLILKNLNVKFSSFSGFIFVSDCFNLNLINVTVSSWKESNMNPLFYFQNISSIRIENFFLNSINFTEFSTSFLFLYDCLVGLLKNIIILESFGLSLDITRSHSINISQISIVNTYFNNELIKAESTILTFENFIIINAWAENSERTFIFSFKGTLFNISVMYSNNVSAEALLNYRDAEAAYFMNIVLENILNMRTIFYVLTTFHYTYLNDLDFKNSEIPRFAEFINVASFVMFTPVISMIRIKLTNITLPAIDTEFFAAFTKMQVFMMNSVFENLKRIGIARVTPYGIIFVSRNGGLEIYNSTFKAVGYYFPPKNLQAFYNYPLFFITFLLKYSIKNSYF